MKDYANGPLIRWWRRLHYHPDQDTFKFVMAGPIRRALYRWFGVPLPEVMLPEYIVERYEPKGERVLPEGVWTILPGATDDE